MSEAELSSRDKSVLDLMFGAAPSVPASAAADDIYADIAPDSLEALRRDEARAISLAGVQRLQAFCKVFVVVLAGAMPCLKRRSICCAVLFVSIVSVGCETFPNAFSCFGIISFRI